MTADRIRVHPNGVLINDYTDTEPNRMNVPSYVGIRNHGNGDNADGGTVAGTQCRLDGAAGVTENRVCGHATPDAEVRSTLVRDAGAVIDTIEGTNQAARLRQAVR